MTLPRTWFQLLLILLVTVGAYYNSFNASFHFDDETFIVQNVNLRHASDIHAITGGILHEKSRAVGFLTFSMDYHLYGTDVRGYHLTNFIIHLITGLCVWLLTRLIWGLPSFKPVSKSFIEDVSLGAALLFVAHPIQTQSVTYISQRFESLATMFYLLSLIFFLWGRVKTNGGGQRILAYAAFILTSLLGMFTKEIVLSLPLMILAFELLLIRKPKNSYILYATLIGLLAIIPILFGGNILAHLSSAFESGSHHGDIFTFKSYVLTEFQVLVHYLKLILWPAQLNFDYDWPMLTSCLDPRVLLSLTLLIILGGVGRWLWQKDRRIGIGVLFFTITCLPEFIPRAHVIGEQKLYLISIGPLMAIAGLICFALSKQWQRFIVLGLLTALLAGQTIERNKVWATEITLWEDTVKKSPNKPRCLVNLANAYVQAQRYDDALDYYARTLAINPYYLRALYNRAVLYERLNNLPQALLEYSRVIELNPTYPKAFASRGTLYIQSNLPDKALADYNKALELNPKDPNTLINRGILNKNSGNFNEALNDLNRAIYLDPRQWLAYKARGSVFQVLKEPDKAAADFKKAAILKNIH